MLVLTERYGLGFYIYIYSVKSVKMIENSDFIREIQNVSENLSRQGFRST